jgi:diguanylate cyclase
MGTQQVPNIIDYNNWDRNILKAYWVVITLISIAVVIMASMEGGTDPGFTRDRVLQAAIPIASMYAVLISAEVAIRYHIAIRHYLVLLTGSVVSVALVLSFPEVPAIQASFIHSIFAAVSYYDRRTALFASSVNIGAFLIIYALHDRVHARIGTLELTFTLFFFLNTVLMIFSMIRRGIALHRNMIAAVVERQEMTIRHTIMERQAKVDALTELYNHKSFQEFLDKSVEQADRGMPLQLAILDIDNFKRINDTYGHWAGDLVLKQVAETIRSQLSPEDIGARYGGEEFAIIMTGRDPIESLEVVERIRIAVSEIDLEAVNSQQITISIGFRSYAAGEGKNALFKAADASLYDSKRSGKNRTTVSTSGRADS